MAKKNTLNDLNEFLKSSRQKKENPSGGDFLQSKPFSLVEADKLEEPKTGHDASIHDITSQIRVLANRNNENIRMTLFRIIQEILENTDEANSSDLMLLNTAIYLEHTEKMGEGFKDLLHKKKD